MSKADIFQRENQGYRRGFQRSKAMCIEVNLRITGTFLIGTIWQPYLHCRLEYFVIPLIIFGQNGRDHHTPLVQYLVFFISPTLPSNFKQIFIKTYSIYLPTCRNDKFGSKPQIGSIELCIRSLGPGPSNVQKMLRSRFFANTAWLMYPSA